MAELESSSRGYAGDTLEHNLVRFVGHVYDAQRQWQSRIVRDWSSLTVQQVDRLSEP